MPSSQASPSRNRAYASVKLAPPARMAFTSVPVSARPASSDSRISYSKRARRFSTDGALLGPLTAERRVAAILGGVETPARNEAAVGLGQNAAVCVADARG